MSYHVAHEDEKTFTVRHPDGSFFKVAKSGIDENTVNRIQGLPRAQFMSDGGLVDPANSTASASSPIDSVAATSQLNSSQIPSTPLDIQALSQPQVTSTPEKLGSLQVDKVPDPAPTAPTPTPAVGTPPNAGNLLDQAMTQESAGIKGMAGAKAAGARDVAKAYDEGIKREQALTETYKPIYAKIESDHQNLIDQITNGKIDPNRLWNNMSTGNKVLAGIGLIMGGIGSGLTKQPNAGLQVLQNAVNQDIEAQKSELGKKQTLLSLNMDKYRNTTQAENATRLQYNALMQASVAMATAKAQSAEAQSNGQYLLGKLKQEEIPLKASIAQTEALRAISGGNGQGVSPEFLPPEARERAVSVPGANEKPRLALAGTKEAATEFKKSEIASDELDNKLDTMIRNVKKGPSINPFSTDHADLESDHAAILTSLGHLQDLNRFTKDEADHFGKMLPSSYQMNGDRSLALLMKLKQMVKDKRNAAARNLLEGYRPGDIQEGAPVIK